MATWCKEININCHLVSQEWIAAIGCDGKCGNCESCVMVEEEE